MPEQNNEFVVNKKLSSNDKLVVKKLPAKKKLIDFLDEYAVKTGNKNPVDEENKKEQRLRVVDNFSKQ